MKIFRFIFNKHSDNNPRLDEITEDDLRAENVGFEDFAETVISSLEQRGVYDDSDYPTTICIYYKGAP